MRISETKLKGLIKEAIERVNNPIVKIQAEVEDAMSETSNQIEALQNKMRMLEKVVPTVNMIISDLEKSLQISRMYTVYGTMIILEIANPVSDEDEAEYEHLEDIASYANESVDGMLKDVIRVSTSYKNGLYIGIEIDVDVDSIEGWY